MCTHAQQASHGLDMPSALPCLARLCTPGVVGGVIILPSMSHLVQYQYRHRISTGIWCNISTVTDISTGGIAVLVD
jgi:hypothetical protein